MHAYDKWMDDRDAEAQERKRLKNQRKRQNRRANRAARRDESSESGDDASTVTGQSNDADIYDLDDGTVLGMHAEQYAEGAHVMHHGGGEIIPAQPFIREKTCEDRNPSDHVNRGAIYVQGGNYGTLRRERDLAQHQLHDLKSSPAQVLLLNECPHLLVDFLEKEPEDVAEQCTIRNAEGDVRMFKHWMCVKPNEISWSNAIAVCTSHFGSLKVLHWKKTVDGFYNAGAANEDEDEDDGRGGGRGGGRRGRGGPQRRKAVNSRILVAEAVAHPGRGFTMLGSTVNLCSCHLNYKTAKWDPKGSGLKTGHGVFFDTLADVLKEYDVHVLYGDWNLSLLVVKSELAKRGVQADLCAWMPILKKQDGPFFDTCAMFILGGTVADPALTWGPIDAGRGGGGDGLDWLFRTSTGTCPDPTKLAAVAEQNDTDDDAAVAAGGGQQKAPAPKRELQDLPLHVDAILTSFLPGKALQYGRNKETTRRVCEVNRAALANMLTPCDRHAVDDNFQPRWPRVQQKLLSAAIYDKPDRMLRGTTHIPLAFTTKVESSRNPETMIARNKKAHERYYKKRAGSAPNAPGHTAAVAASPVPVKANPHTYGRMTMQAQDRATSAGRGAGQARHWSPRRRAEQAIGDRHANRHGTAMAPMYVHGSLSCLGRGGARPMAPPATPSRGGGSSSTLSHGGGYAPSSSSSSQGWDWEPNYKKNAAAEWEPGDEAQRILEPEERREWEAKYKNRT